MIYGATRPTYDFDCLPKSTDENLDRLGTALNELGARIRSEGVDDETARAITPPLDARFFKHVMISNFRTDAGDLDVLRDMPSSDGTKLTYDDLAPRAERVSVAGITVALASLDDIIASKEHANRDKDRDALPELHRLSQDARARRTRDSRGGGQRRTSSHTSAVARRCRPAQRPLPDFGRETWFVLSAVSMRSLTILQTPTRCRGADGGPAFAHATAVFVGQA